MLEPQHMRWEIDGACWLTSWRQRACDSGWPVVGWLKENRMTWKAPINQAAQSETPCVRDDVPGS
jgi:hypothetical protein